MNLLSGWGVAIDSICVRVWPTHMWTGGAVDWLCLPSWVRHNFALSLIFFSRVAHAALCVHCLSLQMSREPLLPGVQQVLPHGKIKFIMSENSVLTTTDHNTDRAWQQAAHVNRESADRASTRTSD
ncbi:hypothetical protein CgunFtcFv8_022734 [Champsocephalus gunnari]|uniref:Uncharacterized protein n=1 Tax=Champsocephalus gunnari TaxID=52237 RepID=A0AAN8DQ66_CHAGU|nr:hypothetical protein CgunFtcFv8_022734 [Champsocephalus gunnari]